MLFRFELFISRRIVKYMVHQGRIRADSHDYTNIMPDVFIHNQTSHILNIGFWVGTPLCFVNEVKPDQKIKVHLASFAHTIEARVDNGSNRYSTGETWQKAGELGAACAAGTSAVVVGTAWLTGLFGKHTSPVASAAVGGAGLAWGAAHAGLYIASGAKDMLLLTRALCVQAVRSTRKRQKEWC